MRVNISKEPNNKTGDSVARQQRRKRYGAVFDFRFCLACAMFLYGFIMYAGFPIRDRKQRRALRDVNVKTGSATNKGEHAHNVGGSEIIIPKQQRRKTALAATKTKTPRFFFGHSTGHSGSTAVHKALIKDGCPWETVENFEDAARREHKWPFDPDCMLTKKLLVPQIMED